MLSYFRPVKQSHKQTHHLSQEANSFVETVRETYYEIAFQFFHNNNWIIYVYV